MTTPWQSSVLWKKLLSCDKHDAGQVVTILENWMPEIESVLKHGGSSPADFTLHDDEHAQRVVKRMAEIIPPETLDRLCPYELAFLLLSGYLHDIGMTPESKKVSLHYQYLVTGSNNGLADTDVAEFQAWLDNDQQGLTPPLCVAAPTPDELRRANRLVAHYCRHRHNDWSADWIRDNLPNTSGHPRPLGTFDDWTDDLIRLCRSHHFGWDELLSDEFSPRLVGNPGQVLHMRYFTHVSSSSRCVGVRSRTNTRSNSCPPKYIAPRVLFFGTKIIACRPVSKTGGLFCRLDLPPLGFTEQWKRCWIKLITN